MCAVRRVKWGRNFIGTEQSLPGERLWFRARELLNGYLFGIDDGVVVFAVLDHSIPVKVHAQRVGVAHYDEETTAASDGYVEALV